MSSEPLQVRLGKAIRAHREALEISQEAFADKLNVHRTYYGAVELGKQNLTLRSVERIAEGLGVPVSSLFVAADKL